MQISKEQLKSSDILNLNVESFTELCRVTYTYVARMFVHNYIDPVYLDNHIVRIRR